jgi:hypothetical protein
VTAVAFSLDGTCLPNDKLVPAVKLSNYAVAVNFPATGIYTLCLALASQEALNAGVVLYTAQVDARITVQLGV